MPDPPEEVFDLYLVTDRPEAHSAADVFVSWQSVTMDLNLIGDVTPSALETAMLDAQLPLALLKRGTLLTDVSDISFPVFVPGERTLVHPLPRDRARSHPRRLAA